ncbi:TRANSCRIPTION FACTOR MYB8-RELATED-RELATED [Salix viminalis]|uniref:TRANSCRIPTION FACTOR MYB8-RELATED-RELATED n=1 Tax=Salix viminalis TaxID=40686 RepID=A0A9Q0YZ33_SALVM|nr:TRANSCRIPTION FACTOR MYB8-RELATED-RELATED [Salix viminalis]
MEKGAWTAGEDRKLAEVIEIHGAKRWRTIASRAGKQIEDSNREGQKVEKKTTEFNSELKEDNNPRNGSEEGSNVNFNIDDFFDFSDEDPSNLEWMSRFLEMDEA